MRFFNSIYFKLLLVPVLLFVIYLEVFKNTNKDLDVFIGASKLIFDGKTCYDVWLHSGSSGLKYFYSPLFGILIFPLKDLPQVGYVFIWLCLNLFLSYRLIKLIPAFLPLGNLSFSQRSWFWLLLFLTTVRSYYDTLGLGQMTIILVWGSLESMRLLSKGKSVGSGAILALIINIKLIPIALLGYLVYKAEWKTIVSTVLFSILYLLLPALFIGYDFNNQLVSEWLGSLSNTGSNSLTDDYGRQSLSAFIPALFTDTPLQFETSRNIMNLAPEHVSLILNSCRLAVVVLLAFLFGKPFQKIASEKFLFFDLALICLVTPLFFPHQGKYSFFYLMPAQAWCVYYFVRHYSTRIQEKKFRIVLILSSLSFILLTLTTDGLIGRKASNWCEYFNFITYGAFLLLAVMILLRPKADNNRITG